MKKLNCWEIYKCGREPGGDKVDDMGVCPACIDESCNGINNGENAGRICWAVAGTFCGGKVQGDFALKSISCMSCKVFKQVKLEEGEEDFILLKPGQVYKFPSR